MDFPNAIDAHTVAIALAVAGMLASVFFTVVPLLPGTLFVLLGAIGYGLVDSFAPFAWWFWVGMSLMALVYLAVDNIAQFFGVQRVGGSRSAMFGGTIGVFVGPLATAPLLGPLALFVGPPLGAVAGTLLGEAHARRRTDEGIGERGNFVRLGGGALAAYVVGMVAKFMVLTAQLVWLGLAIW